MFFDNDSEEKPNKKPLVLIVEDDEVQANSISKAIQDHFTPILAINGIEAFERLKKHRRFLGMADNGIHCILLDIQMPKMNGLQFLEKLLLLWRVVLVLESPRVTHYALKQFS